MAFPTLNVTPGTGQTINTLPNAGQQGSANSLPVVIANDQSAIAVSASSLPLPAGAAQESGGNLAVVATASGAPTDAAYAGTGNPSIIALLKGLYTSLTGTLTTSISGPVAVTGTFWQVTQPVSASTLPLPTGAATSAKQPALGTAGMPSSDVLTVQGAPSMTALKVDGSAVTQPISASSLPLPAGAAQESGGNLAVVATASGAPTDVAYAGTGNPSIIALLKGLYANLAGTLTTRISGPVAVTGTFWQTTQPISAANLPLPTGAATAANQPTAAAQGSMTSGQTGPLTQGAVSTSSPTYTTGQTNPLSLTTAGALRVDGSAVTQPVNGTVTANPGTGTFAVSAATLPLPTGAAQESGGNLAALATAAGTPADTAWAGSGNSSIVAALKAIYAKVTGTLTTTISGPVAVTGTFWQTTQPVSAVTLPLPAGASTAANQTNVQSAPGTSASTALTVQGSASGVTIPVNGTVTANAGTGTFTVSAASLPLPTGAATSSNQPTNAAQGSTTSGQTGLLVQGAVTTGAPVYTTAQTNPLSLDTSGNLRVAQPDVCATSQSLAAGTLNTAVSIPLANAQATIGWVVSGLTASGATLTTELSKDGGTTWAAAANTSPGSGNTATTLTADGSFRMHCAGSTNARLRVSTIGTGSITVAYTVTAAPGIISIGDPLPQGANTIGNVQLWAAAASRWLHAAVPGGDIVNSTTAITLNAAGISGIKNYLTGLQIFAGGTIATGSEVYVRDGASGSYLWRGYIGAGAQGDIEVKFDNPLAGSAATAMLFGCVTAMGASSALYVNAQGFQAS